MIRYVVLLTLLILAGCSPATRVYPLPAPPAEAPVCNLPYELRQQNWTGKLNQGSCVYASLINHVRWLNLPELATEIRRTRGDGEYASRLMQYLDSKGIEYTYTEKADPRFLDECTKERRGCILWWKPSHCCTFVGWVRDQNGNQYAAILDNNYITKFEYTPREQFVRLWAGYGGFALSVTNDPAIPIPYRSYEER
jgi:hypothetical protein